MFLLNRGWFWSEEDEVDGYVYLPSGVDFETAQRRPVSCSPGQLVLFDPQLYLADLDGNRCRKTCANLATYPWFPTEAEAYNSGQSKRSDWRKSVRDNLAWIPGLPDDEDEVRPLVQSCISFQERFNVSHLLLPTPLLDTPSIFEQEVWLEVGREVAAGTDIPVLAAIAIEQHLLKGDPQQNQLLGDLISSLPARGIDGIYLCLAKDDAQTRVSDADAVASILYISLMGEYNDLEVILNFVDDLGCPGLSMGAAAFASGYYNKDRRLCFNDYTDRSFGRVYPKFYSNALFRDFSPEPDLQELRLADLHNLIQDDWTPASETLSRALNAELEDDEAPVIPPDWAPNINNVASAKPHRSSLLAREAKKFAGNRNGALQLLQHAEAGNAIIDANLEGLSDPANHARVWREEYQKMLGLAVTL